MANPYLACLIVQMHAVGLTLTAKKALRALSRTQPLTFSKRLITVFPYIHEIIFVDVSLRKVTANTGTSTDRAVNQYRGHANTGIAAIKSIAHFGFVTAQKSFAGEV